jgi:DNA-binding XRE family transcriptional regulator
MWIVIICNAISGFTGLKDGALVDGKLADLIGVSRQTISAIEKGDYNPTINLCIAICRQLDKTLDELFWE